MNTIIIAKKDLYNAGKCFTKGKEYELPKYKQVNSQSDLIDTTVINDQGEPHSIGMWWKSFKIVNKK